MSSFVFSRSSTLGLGTVQSKVYPLVFRHKNKLYHYQNSCSQTSYSLLSNVTSVPVFQRCCKFRLLKSNLACPAQKRSFIASSVSNVRSAQPVNSSKTNRNSASAATSALPDRQELQPALLKKRFLYVQTSIDRWEEMPGGLTFDVGYLDSAPDQLDFNPSVPLVVSLHTTPGSFYDLQPVLEAFVKSGCRVLAPAFPGSGFTSGVTRSMQDMFAHSTSEKADFVQDFLRTIGTKKVDLLIGQGAGCYTAIRLTGGEDVRHMYKAVALLSPWPDQDFKCTEQKNLLPLLHDMWERPFYRPIARVLSKFFANTRNTTVEERMALIYTLYQADFAEVTGYSMALGMTDFPRLLLFAEDDPLVEAAMSYKLAEVLGLSDRLHRISGALEKDCLEQFPSCVVFDKGGQELQNTQFSPLTALLLNFLKSVRTGFRPY